MQIGDLLRPPDVIPRQSDVLPLNRREMPQILLGVGNAMVIQHLSSKIKIDRVPENNSHRDEVKTTGMRVLCLKRTVPHLTFAMQMDRLVESIVPLTFEELTVDGAPEV